MALQQLHNQKGRLWQSGSIEYARNGVWPYLSLGWSSAAWNEAEVGDERAKSWLLTLAFDRSLDLLPPWMPWGRDPDAYALKIFPEHRSTSTNPSRKTPPHLDSFELSKSSVFQHLLIPAAIVVDPRMKRPLASVDQDGALSPEANRSLQLAPLVVGVGSATARWEHKLVTFWKPGTWRWYCSLVWSMEGTSIAPECPPDFYLTFTDSEGTPHHILVMELKLFVQLQTMLEMVKRGKDKRAQHVELTSSALIEEDALLGQPLLQADALGSNMACLSTGGGMMVIMERVKGKDDSGNHWRIFKEVVCATAFQPGMGEAGAEQGLSAQYVGKRTSSQQASVLSEYSALPILLGLSYYAKRAFVAHAFDDDRSVGSGSQGSEIVESEAAHSASVAPPKSTSASTAAAPGTTRSARVYKVPEAPLDSSSNHRFHIARSPLRGGQHSSVWKAWEEGSVEGTQLLFKRGISDQLYVELEAYTKLRHIQGTFIPSLIGTVSVEGSLSPSTAASSGSEMHTTSTGSGSSCKSVEGLVITDMGTTLDDLAQVCQCPAALSTLIARRTLTFMRNLASYLAQAGCRDATAAFEHLSDLVMDALHGLHAQNVLHGDVAGRNICLRIDSKTDALVAAFIDLEGSYALLPVNGLDEEAKQRQQKSLDEEEAAAKASVKYSVSAFWPRLAQHLQSS